MSERRFLHQLMSEGGNGQCADCGRSDPPADWASVNLGVFVCIECSGAHRKVGTHVSKVRSVELDSWSQGQLDDMSAGGNDKANAKYAAAVPAICKRYKPGDNTVFLEEWVKGKYEREEFTATERGAELRRQYLCGRREGMLLKKGKDKDKWAPRWCVLADGHFSYYIHRGDPVPKGKIPIEGLVMSLDAERQSKAVLHQFTLLRNDRAYFFATEGHSPKEYVDWVNTVRSAQALNGGITDLDDPAQNAPEVVGAVDQQIVLEGYVWKQGPKDKSSWKQRWFVLTPASMSYYKGPMEAEALGSIAIPGQGLRLGDGHKEPSARTFTLEAVGRVYSFKAEDEESKQLWVSAIRSLLR